LILPLFRITNLFLTIEFFWKTIVLYNILFFLVLFYCIKFKINPGYKIKGLVLLPLVIVLGIFLGMFGNILFEFEKYFGILFLIPLIAYTEEVLFRGMIQNLVKENYGVLLSILISSLLYGIFTMSFGVLAIFMFFIGLILSLIYLLTKNIYLTIVINAIIHLFLFVF
jgi:membrane protease YdiL (CAAX protease family)